MTNTQEISDSVANESLKLPAIIQGGMGVGVSGWRLAKTVASHGQLGVVSGTALELVVTRFLQLGDANGDIRRALAAFPYPEIAQRVQDRYWIEGGKAADAAFITPPMFSVPASQRVKELTVVSAFVAIYLAKEGHQGFVGLNLLEKIQMPSIYVLYGAMLAGVDVVLVGAGIPRQVPGVLDALARGEKAGMKLDVIGGTESAVMECDPAEFGGRPQLKRPVFLAIVSSPVLAENLKKKSNGRVDGFVVEAPIAGGHNAPPRGPMKLNELGEPIYGERDAIDPAKFVEVGLPFWLAGGYGSAGKLAEAQAKGAMGIQVGTAFALSDESGFEPVIKAKILDRIRKDDLTIRTDAIASPTGFPFKVAQIDESLSHQGVYEERCRVCDLGMLREVYQGADGKLGYRCAAEPLQTYIAKGGDVANTQGRKCLCNALCAAAGIGQVRKTSVEPQLITMGDDVQSVKEILGDKTSYSAKDVIDYLLK